jgi:hypothetical protein
MKVFATRLTSEPSTVPGTASLFALNIDPESAAARRERVIGPDRGVLSSVAIASMEEQVSGACTVEIAAFEEFTKLARRSHLPRGENGLAATWRERDLHDRCGNQGPPRVSGRPVARKSRNARPGHL